MRATQTSSLRCETRRRGVVLVFVLVAVLMAATLASTFLGGQSTSIGIARNVDNQARARFVAESGLELAIAHVRSNSSWRTDQSHGTWVTDEAFGQGTFTIVGEDGLDSDGDGIIDDGDKNLADDDSDPLTLTVTGKYGGASHSVRAVVTPVSGSCSPGLVVSDQIEAKGKGMGKDAGKGKTAQTGDGSRILPLTSGASITTNSTSKDKIKAKEHAVISTDVYIGPGKDPDKEPGDVVTIEGDAKVTGTIYALDEAIAIPTLTEPINVGSDLGNLTLSSGTTTWTTDRHHGKLEVKNSAILQIDGDVTVLCDDEVKFKNDSQLNILKDSTFTLYVKKKCKVENDALLNIKTSDPTKFIIRYLAAEKDGSIEIKNDSQVCATVEGPACELKIKDNAFFYGTFIGEKASFEDAGQIYVACRDDAGSYTYSVQWQAAP